MAEIARKIKRYPSDLTNGEWERIKPLLPMRPKRGRKSALDLRKIRNAIRYMVRSAGDRRMLPTDFGPGRRCGGSGASRGCRCSAPSTTWP
jgi:putative transposase